MTSRIIFSNPGEIDPRLITLMGVNVKDATLARNSSPIGYFGTGLKYAIAVAARLNQKVTIFSGLDEITFDRVGVKLREKDFDQIRMTTTTPTPGGGTQVSRQFLGFTTELGKAWEPWMAYREIYCNALDEGGEITDSTIMPEPTAGMTHIVVEGAAMMKAHHERSQWLLTSKPIATLEYAGYKVAVHPPQGDAKAVFYQGIRVGKLDKPGMYSYNMLSQLQLSEDRQISDSYEPQRRIAMVYASGCTDKELLKKVILSKDGTFESQVFWSHAWSPTQELVEVVDELFDNNYGRLPGSLLELVKGRLTARDPQAVRLTRVQEVMLKRAKAVCEAIGQPVTEEIVIVESLGSQWLAGMAKDGRIFIPISSFGKGTKFIASTLLEEHLHCSLGLHDCSREMQDWLFDKVLSLAEDATGEPL